MAWMNTVVRHLLGQRRRMIGVHRHSGRPAMKSTRHLLAGAVVAAATAALVWGPTAILAGISMHGIE